MKLLTYIFNRIIFLRAEFAADGSYRTQTLLWHSGSLTPGDRAAAKNTLTALVVCGHGVVGKPDAAELVARVKADSKTFLWSTSCGQTFFVRRERLGAVSAELDSEGIIPMGIFCADTENDFAAVAAEFAGQLYASLRWRTLLRTTPKSSALAQVLVRQIGFPVLGLFLGLLAANAVLAPGLNTQRQTLQTELARREQTVSGAASVDARQRKLLAEFAAASGSSRAVLCDRIGRAVPEQIILTTLQIEPLTKRFEGGKPLQRHQNRVVICGTAPAAGEISAFAQRLSETECCRDVRLVNVEKEREGDRLTFRIESTL